MNEIVTISTSLDDVRRPESMMLFAGCPPQIEQILPRE